MELLSEVVLSVRSLVFSHLLTEVSLRVGLRVRSSSPPSQGGVPECRSVEPLSEGVLSARSLAFTHLLREVTLSVGPWNFTASWC